MNYYWGHRIAILALLLNQASSSFSSFEKNLVIPLLPCIVNSLSLPCLMIAWSKSSFPSINPWVLSITSPLCINQSTSSTPVKQLRYTKSWQGRDLIKWQASFFALYGNWHSLLYEWGSGWKMYEGFSLKCQQNNRKSISTAKNQ